MPRFAANLTMMYNEHAFLDRFAAAAKDGFKAVEFLFPYDIPAADIEARLEDNGCTQALFNAPPGDWAAGERGIASLPGREDEFRSALDTALEYAHGARLPTRACDGRPDRAGRRPRESMRAVYSDEPRAARRARRRRGRDDRDRADQYARHPRLLPEPPGRGACDLRRSRRAEPQGAVGPLPLPDRRRRSRDEAQRDMHAARRRPYPDRRRAGAARARYRRTELPLSLRR